MQRGYKQPVSVLVVIHNPAGEILLLERADRAGFWQSVTGSLEEGETPFQAALREVAEETGVAASAAVLHDWHYSSEYAIYAHWRHRYAPGVTHNREHVFSLCIESDAAVKLAVGEHVAWGWFAPAAAAERVFSPSNREAILALSQRRACRNIVG